jgi:hypothetical protein
MKPMRVAERSQGVCYSRAGAAASVGIDANVYTRGSQIIAANNGIRGKP